MKLHLPHKFQAALMAALGAVAFPVLGTGTIAVATGACLLAGQQAQAEETTRSETWDIPRSGTTVTGEALSLTGISCITTQMDKGAVKSNDVFAPDTNVGNGNTWTLTFTIKNETNHEVTLDSLLLDVSMFNSSGDAQNTSTVRTVKFTLSQNGTALDSFDNILRGKGDVTEPVRVNDSDAKPLLTFADGVQLAANSSKQFTLKVERGSNQTAEYMNGCFYGLIDMVANYSYEIAPCVWSGAGGHTTWTDSSAWTGGAPTAETPVVFNASGSTTTVTIGSSVAAASVAVSDKAYTFSGNGTLTTDSLTIADGASLALTNGNTLAVSGDVTLSGSAALSLASGTTLKVSSGAAAKQLMMSDRVANNGTFVLTTNVSLGNGESTQMGGTLAIQGATVTLGTGEGTTASIASFSHVSLDGAQITVNAQNATIKGVSVANGKTGTIWVDDMKNSPNTVALNGVTQVDGTLNLTNNWNSSFTIEQLSGDGTLNQPAGGRQEMLLTINSLKDFTGTLSLKHDQGSDAININTGTTAVNFNTLELAIGDHTANFTLGANTGIGLAKLTSGTLALSGADTHTLTLGGLEGGATITGLNNLVLNVASGEHVYTGTFAVAGQITKTGAGSQTITGTVLHHTILAQGGTLVLNGNYDISNLTPASTPTYEGGDSSNNGFRHTEGKVHVVNITGGTLSAATATFSFGAEQGTGLDGNGDFTLSGSTDYTTFYVNEGAEKFSTALAQQDMQHIVMSDNTTLKVDTDGALTTLTAHGAANLSNEGQDRRSLTLGSVAGEGSATVGDKIDVTIAGTITGTKDLTALKLASDATVHVTMGTGNAEIVNFGEGTGTVVLKGGSLSYRSDLNGNTLQMQSGSTLLFGNKGDDTDHTYEGKIVVAGNASVTTYGTSQHPTATISGDVSGEGTLTRVNDGNQALNFTGTVDLGGYTNNDAQDGNLTDFRGVTKLGTLTIGNSSKTKFSNESTTIGAVVVNGTGTTEFAHNISLADVSSTGGHQWTLTALDSATVTVADEACSLHKLQTNGNVVLAEGTTMTLGNNLVPFSGTLTVNGTVNISKDVDLSNGNKSDATMVIGGTGKVTAVGMWMCSTSTLKLQEGGQYTLGKLTFTGKGDDTSIAANGNVNYGAANANFTITHAQVTANDNFSGDSTIKNKLVNTSVVAGSHTVAVENAGNTIAGASVSEGGSFTMTSGTLTDVVTSTGGTVALSGITLGASFEQQGGVATYVDLKGAEVTASDNYYLGNTKGYVTVVTGTGEFSGSAISWGDETYSLETDGTITTKDAGADYTTFYINRDSEQISDILEHETKSVQVNAGTLVVNQDASGIAITVSTEGTITGEKADATQVDIQKDAVAHYTGNVEDSAVKFTAEQGKTVDITNKGDEGHKYSISDAGMHVAAQKMELSAAATGDVVVNNHVSVETVENLSTHALTLNDGESEVKNVFATHGDIKFHNTGDAIALVSMTIGEGKQVGAYTGTAEISTNEATVSISNMLTAGKDASLYANLVLKNNSTLNLGGNSMYLGSQLTLQEGLIQFDNATLAAIAALDVHQTLNLFQAADGTQLSYSGVSNEDWARAHFDLSSITDADYKIVANDNVFGIEKVSNIPEPATGTLSLLALCALTARRRRKN